VPWFPDWQPPWRQIPKPQRRRNVARLNAAQNRLWANSDREQRAGVNCETPTYHRLNDRVAHLEPGVPPWQRTVFAHDVRQAQASLARFRHRAPRKRR
jgi:hypothetical protein